SVAIVSSFIINIFLRLAILINPLKDYKFPAVTCPSLSTVNILNIYLPVIISLAYDLIWKMISTVLRVPSSARYLSQVYSSTSAFFRN
ncbi:MAG TPA: hypothetical protein PLZ68_15905, partial [Ferruginibacter sp.]|nr:hypothetical protein [Ferruginibacter sp.]